MADKLITGRKLVFRNLSDDIRSRTVVDHFRLGPHACVCRRLVPPGRHRNTFRSLLTAARHGSLTVGADLDVITRPEVVFSLAVATLARRLHHHLIKLRLQCRQIDSILGSLWTSDTRHD